MDPRAALKSVFGFDDFRPGQEQVVAAPQDLRGHRQAAVRRRRARGAEAQEHPEAAEQTAHHESKR